MIECVATTLFCDIINSTQIANILGSQDYYDFIQEFYKISNLVKADFHNNMKDPRRNQFVDWEARGDEICIIFYSPLIDYKDPDKSEAFVYDDIQDAIKIAVNLKLKWWSNGRNKDRINEQKKVFDLGIGIHSGLVNFEEKKPGQFTKPIGYSISVAKRVESLTRQGKYSKIMLSQSVNQYLRNKEEFKYIVQLVSAGLMSAKGVDDMSVYELRSFRWFSDFFNFTDIDDDTTKSFYKEFRNNPHNIWIGNLLANIEYQKGDFKKANRIFQQLAEIEGESADFFNNIGVTYILMSEEDKGCMLLAEEAFRRAISLDRFYPEYIYNLANLYYRMNRFEEAYINIIKAMTLEKNYPGVRELHDYIVDVIEKKRANPEKYKPLLSEDSLNKGDKEKERQEVILEYFKWKD